jgi:hypothetical protein
VRDQVRVCIVVVIVDEPGLFGRGDHMELERRPRRRVRSDREADYAQLRPASGAR